MHAMYTVRQQSSTWITFTHLIWMRNTANSHCHLLLAVPCPFTVAVPPITQGRHTFGTLERELLKPTRTTRMTALLAHLLHLYLAIHHTMWQ